MRNVVAFALALALSACTRGLDYKVDGSSEAAFKSSVQKIRDSASGEDVQLLEESIRVLAVPDMQIGFEGGILGAMEKMRAKNLESIAEIVLPQVNGKSGREIVSAAQKRMRDQARKQLAVQDAELDKLRKARAEKDSAREFLARIEILDPRLAVVGVSPMRSAILDFKVRNGSEEALASLFLRASVTGANNEVLLTDEFTYRASPPIAADQVREVRLPSSSPSKWNTPQLAGQATLSLKLQVENAATSAGTKLATSFTQMDEARLALLEKQKPELEAIVKGK